MDKYFIGGKKMDDCIVVKSMRDANKMLELGNQIKHIDRDINNRKYLIFLFYKTDKSIKDLENITLKNKKII